MRNILPSLDRAGMKQNFSLPKREKKHDKQIEISVAN